MLVPVHFLPTFYGDIKLTAKDSDKTLIEWENLSPQEGEALTLIGRKFKLDLSASVGTIVVPKRIDKIAELVAKAMKRDRKLLSAVVFKNGTVEELHPYREPAKRPTPDDSGAQPKADAAAVTDTLATVSKALATVPKAAVTVAQPTLGCPLPEFERAEVRATRVLREFLSPQQLADFERTQSFLVVGGDTGHQYVLTSRHAPERQLAKVCGRSVYDVTAGRAVCVHDWVVPAAEELLELKLFLELPRHETYVNTLPPEFE